MPVCPACARSRPAGPAPCPRCGAASDASSSFGSSGIDTGFGADAASGPGPLPQADAWRAVIGEKNGPRYLRRFEALSRPGAPRLGWHWPAFAVTGFWLLYRKLWGWAALYLGVLPLLVVGERQLAARAGTLAAALDGLALLLIAAWLVAPALVADALYLAHCDRVVRRTRRSRSRDRHVARLAARGGTSALAVGVAGVLCGFAVVGVVAGLVLAVVADHAKREKVVDALRATAPARAAIGAFVGRDGTAPASWEDAGYTPQGLPPHVSRVRLDPRNGTIEIGLQVSAAELGAIYLVPQADAAHRVVWSCRADPALEAYTPRSCQTAE